MATSLHSFPVSIKHLHSFENVKLCPSVGLTSHETAISVSRKSPREESCSVRRDMKARAVDPLLPLDYASKKIQGWTITPTPKLKIGIIGFGNFGQFLAGTIVTQGHTVLAYNRSDNSEIAKKMGVLYFHDAHDLCEEHPEVILLCTSILSTESVLRALPTQRLKRSTLFVDVLSVKEFPRNLMLQILPPEFDILCTHPMFGPESGKHGWNNLTFVYDKVRVGHHRRCDRFLSIFEKEGCRMVEMSCAEHDRLAAESQFLTHTVGRMLGKLNLESTAIDTKGYETLLQLVENTQGDSFDLYYGLFMYNVNATEQLGRLEMAFDALRKELVASLHEKVRKQLFGEMELNKDETLLQLSASIESNNQLLQQISASIETTVQPSDNNNNNNNNGEKQSDSDDVNEVHKQHDHS